MIEPVKPSDPSPPRDITPPVPAPYLAGIPQLPDELLVGEKRVLSPAEERRADGHVRRIKQRLFFERRNYEAREKVRIVSEPRPGI